MPSSCCIPTCKSNQGVYYDEDISYHTLPMNIEDREKWISILKEQFNYEFKKFSRICSLHFDITCFKYAGLCVRRKLKKGSVPTVFNFSQDDLQIDSIPEELASTQSGPADSGCDEIVSTDVDIQSASHVNPEISPSEQISCRKVWNQRYFTSVDIDGIECSPEVRRLLERAKAEIIDQRRRIKSLQAKNKRLQKRLQNTPRKPSRKERLNAILSYYKRRSQYSD